MSEKKNAVCNNCTLKLVNIAYRRAFWFRLLREPLKLGMRFLAWWHHVDPDDYQVRTPACRGCIRFYKIALKEKSRLFRLLHRFMNPVFDYCIEKVLTEEDLDGARRFARAASQGGITPQEVEAWMRDMKTGF